MTLRDRSDSEDVGRFEHVGAARDVTELPAGAVYCANRVVDSPAYVESVVRICASCGRYVWIDATCVELAERCERIVCTVCLDREARL